MKCNSPDMVPHTFPSLPDAASVAALRRYISDEEKALHYAEVLSTCYGYADIARKVVLPLYKDGIIDDGTATRAHFIRTLLSFSSLPGTAKVPSVTYHVRKGLHEEAARAARRSARMLRIRKWIFSSPSSSASDEALLTFRIVSRFPHLDFVESLLRLIRQNRHVVEVKRG